MREGWRMKFSQRNDKKIGVSEGVGCGGRRRERGDREVKKWGI